MKDELRRDPLFKQADTLISAAQIQAVGSFTPSLARFPILGRVNPQRWDFFMTIAGVFMANTRLNNLRLDERREDALMEVVAARLAEWDRDGDQAFEDCKQLFEEEFDRLQNDGHDPRFIASDAVGIWIVLNILGHDPGTDEEAALVRGVGALATSSFFSWWDEQ
jgi:hypothetical protein